MSKAILKDFESLKPVGYLELLRSNRSFRQLWLGQVVSQLGDWFDTIAVYTIVLNLTGSGRAVGLVLVARFLPTFFIGPLSGVVADLLSVLSSGVLAVGFLPGGTKRQIGKH